MKKGILVLSLILAVSLSGCAALPGAVSSTLSMGRSMAPVAQAEATPTPIPALMSTQPAAPVTLDVPAGIADLQDALSNLYEAVSPSVVNVSVLMSMKNMVPGFPEHPDLPNLPDMPDGFGAAGEGSGFVWDTQGHIVTNNHVVDGATRITITFADGLTVPAELVGSDPNSDLAVVKVDPKKVDNLRPVAVGDSTRVKVGQFVVAIGNPFGLEGSMTFGIVSALGRTLSVGNGLTAARGSYSISDIIQTDAPVNPGNSGGVLLDMSGRLIGVPTAIESSTNSSAGVGFAVPSVTVQKVVPVLISTGKFEHPYIGIRGGTLTTEVAEAMGLSATTRGVLVAEVTEGGPADEAGLRGSTKTVEIDGFETTIGGDVITAIDGQAIRDFEDLTTYLSRRGEVGQRVNLSILRNGTIQSVQLTLAARPAEAETALAPREEETPAEEAAPETGTVYLGVTGMTLTPEIAEAMDLSEQEGVLVVEVVEDSPADKAGLRGGTQALELDGERVMTGGDVIIAVDGEPITSIEELVEAVQAREAGAEIELTLLRDGTEETVTAELAVRPGMAPREQPSRPQATPKEPQSRETPEARTAPAGGEAWLGVNGVSITAEMAKMVGLGDQGGILILSVAEDSPAAEAGLQGAGLGLGRGRGRMFDADIILAADGQKVATMDELVDVVQSKEPGDELTLTVLRDGEEEEVAVTLSEQPQD